MMLLSITSPHSTPRVAVRQLCDRVCFYQVSRTHGASVVCFYQVSRCVLAQWPLRHIRSYECTGRGRFALETGSHAAQGGGCYVLHTRGGHDGILYDKIDSVVNEQASLHGVSINPNPNRGGHDSILK